MNKPIFKNTWLLQIVSWNSTSIWLKVLFQFKSILLLLTQIIVYFNSLTFNVTFEVKQLPTMWNPVFVLAHWFPFVQQILRFNTKSAADFICCPPQTNSDKDVQFKDNPHWGHRQAIAASTALPLLSVAADRRRDCIDKLPWKGLIHSLV